MITNSVFLSRPFRFVTVALVAVLTLGLSQTAKAAPADSPVAPLTANGAPGVAQFHSEVEAANYDPAAMLYWDAPQQNEAGMSASGGLHQGIKMHGHWVIDIKNADGTLASHHDFENSLYSPSGGGFLAGLLGGYFSAGDMAIVLGPQSGNGACVAAFDWCLIGRSLATYPALGYCGGTYLCTAGMTETVNFGTSYGGPFNVVLAGSITANQTGTVGSVYTLMNACANNAFGGTNPNGISTTSPSSCVTNTTTEWYGPLSNTNITPVAVNNGQIIQVTVTISFS